MTEVQKLLQRQSDWQKKRSQLSWPEKIRIAERLRSSIQRWCSAAGKGASRR